MSTYGRHHPATQPWKIDLNRPVIVFVTVCTKFKRKRLASDTIHQLLIDTWKKADHWVVGNYVILPDHVHLFAAPASLDSPGVRQWTNYWKGMATRHWPEAKEFQGSIWQPDAWDRQLRNSESYQEKWNYVRDNPVRHGLVKRAGDWPYQGRIQELDWYH